MSEDDYKELVKQSISSLKELMAVEFTAIKTAQAEDHRFSEKQIDHVYEVIKILSKKMDDSFVRSDAAVASIAADVKVVSSWQYRLLGAVAVGTVLAPLAAGIIIYFLQHGLQR